MKEFIEIIKKLWENKRTRALAILIVYVIFFIIVFSIFGNIKPSSQIVEDPSTTIELKDLNIVQMEFIGQHNFKVVDNTIIYNDISYSIEEKPLELTSYDISIFTPLNIDNLIDSAVLESTNYVDKTNTYLISSNDFEKIIYDNIVDSNSNIRITLNEEDISYVHIDLKEYYGYEVRIDLRS